MFKNNSRYKTIVIGLFLLIEHLAFSSDIVIGYVQLNIYSNIFANSQNNIERTNDTLTIEFNETSENKLYNLSYIYSQNSKIPYCLSKDIEWLQPKCMTHNNIKGEFYYHFKCLLFVNGKYKIIINETTKQTAWISECKQVNFIDFEKCLSKRSFFQTFSLNSNFPIKVFGNRNTKKTFSSIDPINLPCYRIIKRKNDWVKIKIDRNTSCTNPMSPTGWVKLFNEGKLQYELKCR